MSLLKFCRASILPVGAGAVPAAIAKAARCKDEKPRPIVARTVTTATRSGAFGAFSPLGALVAEKLQK